MNSFIILSFNRNQSTETEYSNANLKFFKLSENQENNNEFRNTILSLENSLNLSKPKFNLNGSNLTLDCSDRYQVHGNPNPVSLRMAAEEKTRKKSM